MDYRQRINAIIDAKGKLSLRRFSHEIGISEGTFSKQMAGERQISIETLSAILNTFGDISAEWLLRGKGEMLLSEQPEDKPEDVGLLKRLLNNLLGTCEDQRKQIERLEQLKDLAASKE